MHNIHVQYTITHIKMDTASRMSSVYMHYFLLPPTSYSTQCSPDTHVYMYMYGSTYMFLVEYNTECRGFKSQSGQSVLFTENDSMTALGVYRCLAIFLTYYIHCIFSPETSDCQRLGLLNAVHEIVHLIKELLALS